MRTIIPILTSLLLLAACEAETATFEAQSDPASDTTQRGFESPANAENPYDDAGLLYNDILEAYLKIEDASLPATSVVARLDSIADNDLRFTALITAGYSAPSVSAIEDMLLYPATSTTTLISASGMGTAAKSAIAVFLTDVTTMYADEATFEEAYDFITDYESDVIASTLFTGTEKEILLSTSSLARYGYWFSLQHKKRKPRDRDWDYLITTLTSGMEGAQSDTASAIMKSTAAAAIANL